ncbi:hypothetical protein GYMLUDRAFT_938951 [Collybiopsis luxurians FD-317 M1]|uniref:Unplaced genomic scaffold GYMLUscaffold_82, whole genome shotgun sequence n=1 Tax=Collybiopsis luxurians FD-317 M1 TaxID=944289 RepID=A0A0D0ASK3_9AGAR|nr:hypothetical protein GYMLUDRAFT_938951 [Collybiopsis luxurians FD-317 M1]
MLHCAINHTVFLFLQTSPGPLSSEPTVTSFLADAGGFQVLILFLGFQTLLMR